MQISGTARATDRRFRRRLTVAAVTVGALAGLAMPTHGGAAAAPASTASPVSAVHA